MAAISSLLGCKLLRQISRIKCVSIIRHYASANRVKPFKKVGISDRARNVAKALQMRTEASMEENAFETGQTVESVGQSLASRGYLRPIKPYCPPEDAMDKVLEAAKSNNIANSKQHFESNEQKFKFLAACYEIFKHSVPNSQLHEITSVADVVAFYQTAVDTTLPLDTLKTVDLPENLYIQHEYIRFHPETDTMFGGKSAFPKSSTIVTGLKYKDKYRGHTAKKSWP
ncbi:large ribosomal subunit protein mL50 [Topomyia yanbarensis]|uniref:large ribosomal subunit protein mL50 n=1 Tax=Topomyia yanbarensis TaxID=2498891 RepID=UPI00273CEC4F|nr:large ribosomal subunit protein mL50 [Topomyia yanbarensis]